MRKLLRIVEVTVASLVTTLILILTIGMLFYSSDVSGQEIVAGSFIIAILSFVPLIVYIAFFTLVIDFFFSSKSWRFKIMLMLGTSIGILIIAAIVGSWEQDGSIKYYVDNYLLYFIFAFVGSFLSYPPLRFRSWISKVKEKVGW